MNTSLKIIKILTNYKLSVILYIVKHLIYNFKERSVKKMGKFIAVKIAYMAMPHRRPMESFSCAINSK